MTWCPHNNSTSNLCDPCRGWRNTLARMYQRALRAERRAEGWCIRCGKKPPVDGKALCIPCSTRDKPAGGRRGLPESPQAEAIVAGFLAGAEPLELARSLKVAKETVYATLDRRGIRSRARTRRSEAA